MAEIKKYTAQVGLNPAGAPGVRVSNVLGEAVQGLGNTISSVATAFDQRKQERENFKAQNDYRTFQLQLQQEMDAKAAEMAPGGDGFHDDFVANTFRPRRDAFLANVPERLRPKFQTLLDDASGADATEWSVRAATKERDEMYRWAGEQLGITEQQLATAINIEPERYDQLLQAGYDDIDSSPLPAAAKATRKREWENVAQVAHLTRLMETNPEQVILELGADPSNLSPTTQYDLLERAVIGQESGGDPRAISPAGAVGVMQVMPGTAREIAEELQDPRFNQDWDQAQINEYLMNPAVGMRYGRHYLQKQLRKYRDLDAALIAYNGGPGRADAWLKAGKDDSVLPAETRNYYKQVKARMGVERRTGGSPKDVSFVWVRDGGMANLVPGDERLEAISSDLRDRVSTAFAAVGVDKVKLRSGFRDPGHNKDVGGAKNSEHTRGNAMDIDVAGVPLARRLEIIRSLSANGVTGIGVYANTIHADIGGRRAWGPDHSGNSVPKWAKAAIDEHLANKAVAPSMSGRYASMPFDKRQQFIRSADQVITQRYNEVTKTDAVAKVEVRRSMDNELASLAATGQGTGIDETRISTILGEDDYIKFMESRDTTVKAFNAKQGIALMSPQEMGDRLEDYKAQPGSPNFANEQRVERAVEREIERVTRLRSTDPGKAALEFPDVADAYKTVQESMLSGTPDAEAVQTLVKMMLEKQAQFNIAPDTRAPIPRDWAMQIGQSLTRVPEMRGRNAEEVRAAITAQYVALQQFFGEFTEEVIIHSLGEYKGISKPMSELLTGYMQAIEAGGDPLRLNRSRAEDQSQVEGNSRGWFQSITDWFSGDEPGDGAPGEVTDATPNNEVVLRIMSQLDPDDPSSEMVLVQRYGQAAVDVAKARAGAATTRNDSP